MNELALCAGNGALSLGLRLCIPNLRTVCYVEREAFCVEDLARKGEAGVLDAAPIWSDLRTFDGVPWREVVDLVSAGFPCQPFSTASRGRANAEDLWPFVWGAIHTVEPGWVFLENVQRSPIEDAAEDLADLGYRVAFDTFSAADVGAPHRRPRWWLLAHADGNAELLCAIHDETPSVPATEGPWDREPSTSLLGVDVRAPNRVDRLRSIGNGVVPLAVAYAFRTLHARLVA